MARVELLVTVDKLLTDADLASQYESPVVGASVLVKLRSTGNPVTVYAAETGGTTISNPLVTDANGRANGWVDEASLILTISGAGITTYNQPYEATRADELVTINGARISSNTMPGSSILDNSIPNTKLASAAVLGKHLAESAMPLGTILPWWQPSKPGGGFTIPTGFALCNGQALTAGNHDFSGGGTVTLPNLISKQLIGADPASAYNATGAVVGMNGAAGSNTANLAHTHILAHTHTIASHSHQVADHAHGMSHTHGAFVPDHVHGIPSTKVGSSGPAVLGLNGGATYGYGGVNVTTNSGTRSNTDGSGVISTINQTGGTVTGAASNDTTTSAGSASQDMRSAVIGVLYIMKVRNTV